jgi:hypothetical protein
MPTVNEYRIRCQNICKECTTREYQKQTIHCIPRGRRHIAHSRKRWKAAAGNLRFPMPWSEEDDDDDVDYEL